MTAVRQLSLYDSQNYQTVPRSKSTIHEFDNGNLYIGDDVMHRVRADLDTPPETLIQMASDALLLAEYLRERQSAVQAEKEAEKAAQEAQVEKEAQALFESGYAETGWKTRTESQRERFRAIARKAREIHGVSK